MKYTIQDLKKVHFDALKAGSRSNTGEPVASVVLHRNRPEKKIGRNDLRITKRWLMDHNVITKQEEQIPMMCANFPEDKIQIAFYPSGLEGVMKEAKTDRAGNISLGVGGLIDNLARANGYDVARTGEKPANKRNYFYASMESELVFEKGKMKVFEFSVNKNNLIFEFRA